MARKAFNWQRRAFRKITRAASFTERPKNLISSTGLQQKRKYKQIEKEHQKILVARAAYHPILCKRLFHIPNGGTRHILEAVEFKRMGVKKGIPDFFLPYASNGYHGLFLELKAPITKDYVPRITKEQKEFMQMLEADGFCMVVGFGWLAGWNQLMDYIGDLKGRINE